MNPQGRQAETIKNTFSDCTESEFVALLQRIISHDGTEPEVDQLVFHFEEMSEHPAGSDLIFYPEDGADDSASGITQTVKEWRAAQGMLGFKED
ncbi:bacteriocin immunity protein [Pseudomonas nunensis]|uniref:Bacteriocin immunity protein n=1 Tax=Pseudomonas nunensis TaxID=2961896 RepID=A0ABY5E9I8_9PSED|nr:bacteriocin immunity protein [Pseudomonas nunensis]KPN91596.1 colicin transporter [Pseudomonas nunensis]MCL5229712.1 bacteriocin immunity protein [Pseudomonas nunensis]UTO11801.1 bacteriocin immunity protein [Pseudomonas nunensis]